MTRLRHVVWWLMDHICAWSGHRFRCWNEPRWVNRLWWWAWNVEADDD